MAKPQEKNIKSYFQSTNQDKSRTKALDPSIRNADELSPVTSSTQQHIGKSKRLASASPPPSKRQDTKDATMYEPKHLDYRDLPPNWSSTQSTSAAEPQGSNPNTLKLTYHQGDMFENVPKGCLLVHACNTQGHWGAGIAKAFKDRYPKAYTVHRSFCVKDHNKSNPVHTGTAQLIAPCEAESEHWIGCVFTSAKYGKAKDKPEAIVQNTVASVKMLLELVTQADDITDIRMCKINSGKFGVPWERTSEALEGIELKSGWRGAVEVWEPL